MGNPPRNPPQVRITLHAQGIRSRVLRSSEDAPKFGQVVPLGPIIVEQRIVNIKEKGESLRHMKPRAPT
jgi:hypothetical protein